MFQRYKVYDALKTWCDCLNISLQMGPNRVKWTTCDPCQGASEID